MGDRYWLLGNGYRFVFFNKKNGVLCHATPLFTNGWNIHAFGFIALCYISKCKLFLPTLEWQYIIKNIIIIAAALVVGRYYLNQSFFGQILKRKK
jgi:hypothetical protein